MQEYPIPEQDYKVVIYCSTYNQHDYIEETLKGFINQKTNFPFCAIIIDDCSTDNQQTIILEYAKMYPEIIKPILLKYNHFQRGQDKYKYMQPWIERSKYVAQCEGDDYWLYENKLQHQVNFMDNHPECSLTYHACKNIFADEYVGSYYTFGEHVKEEYTCEELLLHYPFQTATVLYRSSMWLSNFTMNALSILGLSSVLFFCASTYGRVLGINQQWSVYRRNNKGISNELHKGEKSLLLLNGWIEISKQCDKKISKIVHQTVIAKYLYELYKYSRPQFIDSIKKEINQYPSVAFSVFKRIFHSKISQFIRKK